ncbi:hypothetical protein HPP92_027937 [Vanilla planifolia]|uniref:Uncharacterized protein n=1 Tax=Vanilla planifolia TaxID=51239 RepID=A0A835P894_VANPL|nr:hypothetical protein HPP92_027937 [Vanilla planifolia]KAG0448354.1 hypothetical protein HPP92_027886 [Vanilla planifolia]
MEDGFCNFASSATDQLPPLQPELFFKMSHEIYNYGEEKASSNPELSIKFAYLRASRGASAPPSSPVVPIGMQPHPEGVTMPPIEYYDQSRISPSMSSLRALLSKLPSVGQVPQMMHGCRQWPRAGRTAVGWKG